MCFQLIEGEALAVLEVALHLGAWPTQYYLWASIGAKGTCILVILRMLQGLVLSYTACKKTLSYR
jgi:hypothetical protein